MCSRPLPVPIELEGEARLVRELPPRRARFAEPDTPISPKLRERLTSLGIQRLFTHQAEAFDSVMSGADTMIVTGTSSGKTLCYVLPALEMCFREPAARALMIYPTKALAQDQLEKLRALLPDEGLRIGVYDGDTPVSQRGAIRRLAHIVLTNPDMLHVGVLPGHENWAKFLRSLRLIVLDEAHAYRGVFGSHVANVVRRLLRLCDWYGARPPIVASSATLSNPQELFFKLTGRRPSLIDRDGAPQAPKTIAFFNPPLDDSGRRASANFASAKLTVALAEAGLRVMTFCRARVTTELVLNYARRLADAGGIVAPERIESYRAGYTPEERRQIERALFDGELLGLITTSAMELGVDVGGLDAVVINGYPGSVAGFWQQAGRAGRSGTPGLVVFVAHDDPLEQFFLREPATLLDARHEPVVLHPENPAVLEQQIRCASYERPISASELAGFGEKAIEVAEGLERAGELEFRAERFYFPSFEAPAPKVGIRNADSETFSLFEDERLLGTMERWRAYQQAHEGAVYLHRGTSYVVRTLDLNQRRVELEKASPPHFTTAVVQSVTEPLVVLHRGAWGMFASTLCGLRVTEHVIGYRKHALDGDAVLGIESLDLPPITFETVGIRLDLPAIDAERVAEGIASVHALEHALMAVAPFLAGCDRGDLGSAWYAQFPFATGPALFVFDRTPGGIGLSEKLFESRTTWGLAAERLLETCPCQMGCPSCLLSSRCESNNETLSKPGGVDLLRGLGDNG